MTRVFFNSQAAIWDDQCAEKDTAKLQSMANRLDIRSGDTVLDVGTGTGVFVPYLLKKIGQYGRMVCLDSAEEMLKLARAKQFKGRIQFICADIQSTPLPSSGFNAAVCYSTFPHLHDKTKALKEIFRLLKPGGRLFVAHTASRAVINTLHQNTPELTTDIFPEDGTVRALLTAAGLKDIRIESDDNSYLAVGVKPG